MSRLQKGIIGAAIIYAMVFIAMLILRPGTPEFYHAFFNTYQIIPPICSGIGGVFYFLRGRRMSPMRRVGWLLIGIACLSFALGQCTWTYYESIRGVEVPFPGWSDVGYLGAYPCLIVGVFLLFGSMPVAGRTKLILDSAIAALGAGMLSWHFVIDRQWETSDLPTLGKIITVAYPLGDVITIFGVIVLLKTMTADRVMRRSCAFLAAGMTLLAFFDTSFAIMTLNGTYKTGSWTDWACSFSWIMIGFALVLPTWLPGSNKAVSITERTRNAQTSLMQMILPYLAAFAAFAVICIRDYNEPPFHQIGVSTLVTGLVLILLVILRQMFTLTENRRLTLQLRRTNEGLEETVAQRTRQLEWRTEQLAALHRLTKEINTTLDHDQVLNQVLEHAPNLLGADAAVIRLGDPASLSEANFPIVRQTGFEQSGPGLNWIDQLPRCREIEVIHMPGGAGCAGAYLRAPLLWQGQILGSVGFVRWMSDFDASDVKIIEGVGLEVGAALNNARQYQTAKHAADRDSVTELYNHRAIHQRLDREFETAVQQNRPLSVIMMDLDNFKLFNDTYGHPTGDQVLKHVAKALSETCREGDLAGRYGGDEFIMLLPDTTANDARALAESLRERINFDGFRRPGDERIVPIGLSLGIADYPNDGLSRHDLLNAADSNLYEAKVSDTGIAQTSSTQRSNRKLRAEQSFGTLDSMVTAVDNKDRYTRRHSEDVTDFALWIAAELGHSDDTMRDIRIGGLLHDVGKIGVPDSILRKPGRLTAEEYEIMKQHPHLGALLVGALPGMESSLDAVRSHHERWDGKGYPNGLAGNEIPLLGRILAVADAFSAMTTDRPYRKGMDWDKALAEIEANIGTQFDPVSGAAFLRAARGRRPASSPSAQESIAHERDVKAA
jgi:diguanylate cyclase (GGDEF)-like protein